MVLTTELIYEGEAFRIEAIRADAATDVRRVVRTSDPTTGQKARALLKRTGDSGPPKHNTTQCRSLEDGLFELKAGQLRIVFFYDGPGRVVCTHAFAKKGQRTPRREIDRAKRLRAAYRGEQLDRR